MDWKKLSLFGVGLGLVLVLFGGILIYAGTPDAGGTSSEQSGGITVTTVSIPSPDSGNTSALGTLMAVGGGVLIFASVAVRVSTKKEG